MSRFIPSDFKTHLISYLPSVIINNPIYTDPNLRVVLATIGAGLVLSKALSAAKTIFSNLFLVHHDLASRYGHGSWAVITGSSDGIGKAYAFELASKGFNIVLVGRSREHLETVDRDLKIYNKTLQTRIIVEDFANSYQEGFAERILNQVKDLDISILINNVGSFAVKPYIDIPLADIRTIVLINCLSHSLVTKAFLPKLAARPQKSAIIFTSSVAGTSPRPYVQLYAATKVFIDYLSRALACEHPNIDVLSVKPDKVCTKLLNYQKPGIRVLRPEQVVRSALRALGRTPDTHGHWQHEVGAFFEALPPEPIRRIVSLIEGKKEMKKQQEGSD